MNNELKETELKQLLETVDDSYTDFVIAMLHTAKKYNAYEQIIDFIKSNPQANSSDICEFADDNIEEFD